MITMITDMANILPPVFTGLIRVCFHLYSYANLLLGVTLLRVS